MNHNVAANAFQRILLIKLRHHGDMLLITPVINTLSECYPEAQIDVLMYLETQDMLVANPRIHRLITIDRQWKKEGVAAQLRHEFRLLKDITAQGYDIVVNLADQWRSALITGLSRAPIRLGFGFPKRQHVFWRYCHTHLVDTHRHATQHTVEQNLSILDPLTLPAVNTQVSMCYTPSDWELCQKKLHQQHIGERYIVIQPTSRWFFKCWSEAKWAEVITALHQEGYKLVLTSGPDASEQQMVADILARSPADGVISLSGQLTLRQLASLIDHAVLFLGVDSVPMHMAAALQTPCIALFGPSKLTFWHPWQATGEIIWAGHYGKLPDPDDIDTQTDQRYLDLIPADDVIAAARRQLSRETTSVRQLV
ncbi:putative lipopolysaccharide heptosyltransferase III [Dickeya poaceiphila]|uniref:Lipopolysaccharide heptosyltransferase 3 n=1 Tax=Dickeya poaceiphila TaxID=568768 RepID=A0A5B8IAX0_9GAMM|nr:putative lipopolysaccharide heptosyltransferase III [Dickeya poaceiphila]QDX31722.1 putative lipopolysaccharide heptosyltransferase III [Dickeya poaceiphila]